MTIQYQVANPATGEIERRFTTATDDEITAAITAADTGFGTWRARPIAERTAVLGRIADLYAERSVELASIVSREMGKTTAEATGEIEYVVDIFRYYAEQGARLLADDVLPSSTGGTALVRKTPIGVLLGIMPWNFPYYQAARFAAPNLAAGNTVLLKPAPQCPESAEAMARISADAGLDVGAYLTVLASNEQVESIIADPRVHGVSVTGSERAGSAVAALAGRHLKKVVLELGGSDAYLVLETDDLEAVVGEAVTGRMENAGQSCNAAKRFIVADHLYDEFVDRFSARMSALTSGDPFDPDVDFGPLVSVDAAALLIAQVEDAVDRGATITTSGGRPAARGAFVDATVLTDVRPGMRAFEEELFGPVAVVHRVHDVDEAVELANSSPFGLGGAVFHTDPAFAAAVADRLDIGMVWVNSAEGGGPDLPFGGTKRSGVGRELGPYGIDEFLNKKLIHVPAARPAG